MPRKPTPVEADGLLPCKTGPACGERFDPKLEGARGYCNRCRMAKARGREPGPRRHQPPGKAKVRLRTSVLPELAALITPDVLAANNVTSSHELLEVALAAFLGRKELVSKRVRKEAP